jgi:hypothetical protein
MVQIGNIERLWLSPNKGYPGCIRPAKQPRHKPGEKFLRGPIPWDWLTLAAKQPGRALHVALELWHWVGIKGTREVSLSRAQMALLGVDRYASARGLRALEAAGLVSVVRHRGRHPIVTVLDRPSNQE